MIAVRRNGLRSWFADMGWLYILVIAVVGLAFVFSALLPLLSPAPRATETTTLVL